MSFELINTYPYEIDNFSLCFYIHYTNKDKSEEEVIESFFTLAAEEERFNRNDFNYNETKNTVSLMRTYDAIKLFKRFLANKARNPQGKTTFFALVEGIEDENNDIRSVEYKQQKDYIEYLNLSLFASKINENLNEATKQAIVRNARLIFVYNYLIIKSSVEESKHFYYILKAALVLKKTKDVF
ncbi:hypothetical protein TMA_115 [Thermus phage TMA]|uniref:hypothetical protein n=1 Tax=Thermus phage TMA TaxID=699370 RepID=UPI00021AADE3|nr:hypothetical protein TMA_115 [Thermus phage TMA]BAK53803.1 hypothetical protein TMA_115 [Thermus phage TMA]